MLACVRLYLKVCDDLSANITCKDIAIAYWNMFRLNLP